MSPSPTVSDDRETGPPGPPPDACDVVVAGSGAAGLTAALTAARGGLSVTILEKTNVIGGTSAMSGAGIRVPANHHELAAGIDDSPAEALDYLRAAAPDGWRETEDELWASFATHAPEMLRFVEDHTPLRFALTGEADPLPGLPGWKARGRMLSPRPLAPRILGPLRTRLRKSTQPHIFTYHEMIGTDVYHHPIRTSLVLAPRLAGRWLRGGRGQGTALITGLLKGCLDAGCRILTDTRATRLQTSADGRITGVVIEMGDGRRETMTVRRAVVLATGGFEWNAELLARHFPGPIDFVASPRANEGDGHRMAEEVGAALAHMDQANINPAIPSFYDGRPHGMALFYHAEPNAILVDRTGRRFVDETLFNLGEVLDRRDPATGQPVHLPVWLISDARFLRQAPVIRWYARSDASWMFHAPTIAALAARIGLPADALIETVERFNRVAALGRDDDFGRAGGTGHGDDRRHRIGLEAIDRPPYLAIRFNRSILATKGGPRTNAQGQVLRPDGSVIDGLYCCGVAMANPIGTRAVGAGTTLGPNMTWGYICGLGIRANA